MVSQSCAETTSLLTTAAHLICLEGKHHWFFNLWFLVQVVQKLEILIAVRCLDAEGDKYVAKPAKIDCLVDVKVKMATLGSEHSIAVTG